MGFFQILVESNLDKIQVYKPQAATWGWPIPAELDLHYKLGWDFSFALVVIVQQRNKQNNCGIVVLCSLTNLL